MYVFTCVYIQIYKYMYTHMYIYTYKATLKEAHAGLVGLAARADAAEDGHELGAGRKLPVPRHFFDPLHSQKVFRTFA